MCVCVCVCVCLHVLVVFVDNLTSSAASRQSQYVCFGHATSRVMAAESLPLHCLFVYNGWPTWSGMCVYVCVCVVFTLGWLRG